MASKLPLASTSSTTALNEYVPALSAVMVTVKDPSTFAVTGMLC